MCGIAGIVDFTGRQVERSRVKAMCEALVHRGPDDEGIYESKASEGPRPNTSVIFGHRRLSIIDLETGHQPIFNEDGTVSVVHNGEIYNFKELRRDLEGRGHRFSTKSDTEVIVHLYEEKGEELVRDLRGMFSFALWDSKRERLILAKDFLGKKPLFYSHLGDRIIFASELSALLKEGTIPKDIDISSIDSYLRYLCIPAPDTIYRHVKKVRPAHMLIFEKGKRRETCHWQIDFRKRIDIGEEEATSRLMDILKDSVRTRLVSDVPLGVMLSGGVDSSSVLGLMGQVTREKIKTFSIGFKESDYNELPYARIAAKRFDTDHHEFIVEPRIQELLPKLVRHFGEPYADSSAIPTYYLAQMTSQYVKVALNGDGGDEVFIGYKHHLANLLAEKIGGLPRPLRSRGLFKMVEMVTKNASYNSRAGHLRRFAEAASLPRGERYKRWVCYYSDEMRNNLYTESFKNDLKSVIVDDLIVDIFKENADLNVLEASLLTDISVNLPSDLIPKMDIACMANSMEARSPFLDKRVMEFVASLPVEIKMRNFKLKYLLKTTMDGIVPDENLYRAKRGFAAPIRHWLRRDLKSYLGEVLLTGEPQIGRIFDMDYVEKIVKQHADGTRDYSHHLWLLLMLELWFKEFGG